MSMPHLSQKSGSALLTILLILSALAAIILFATKNAIDSTRSITRADSGQMAQQIAQSGIEEGLLRLTQKGNSVDGVGLTTDQLYGSPDNGKLYTPIIMRRGYTKGCRNIGNAQKSTDSASTYDPDCPFYDVAVRNYVHLTAANLSKFSISDSDLILNTPLSLKVMNSGVNFTLIATGLADNILSVSLDGGNTSTTLSGSKPVNVINSARSLHFIKKASMTDKVVTIQCSGCNFVLEKPAITIDSVGYSGGIQRKLLVTIPKYPDSPTTRRTQVEFSGRFDANGFVE